MKADFFDGVVDERKEKIAQKKLAAVSEAVRQRTNTETASEAWKRVRTLLLENKKGTKHSYHGDSDEVSSPNSINYANAKAGSQSSFNSDFK